jgi:hypothetical protein
MDDSTDQKSFFKHVFNFDDDSKSELLNIVQYALLAIIPVIILNKTMSKYIPEADDQKGSLEISAEILIQIITMFIGLMIIHRIITYVPTYSGEKYPNFSVIFVILAILLITLSLQTKLGEKVSILFERITELWDGKTNTKNVKNNKNNVKVSQPISGQPTNQITNQSAMNQAMFSDGTSINSLPITQNAPASTQQLPNYNNMYQQDTTPLVNAATPGQTEGFNEPMAANSVLGGGFGSSW